MNLNNCKVRKKIQISISDIVKELKKKTEGHINYTKNYKIFLIKAPR